MYQRPKFVPFTLATLAFAVRIPLVFRDLTRFEYCDESLYFREAIRAINENDPFVGQFLAGGINYFPLIWILKFIKSFSFSIDTDVLLILARTLYPVCLSSLAAVLVYAVSVEIGLSRRISLLSSLLYCFSPYLVSQSQILYPDSYSVFFGTLVAYAVIRYLKGKDGHFLYMAGATALAMSNKYTLVVFAISSSFAIVIRCKRENDSFIETCLRLANFSWLTLILFGITNFSGIAKPFKFFAGFTNNLAIYGDASGVHFKAVYFYLTSSIVLPVGFVGIPLIILGILQVIKTRSTNFAIVLSPTILLPLSLASGELMVARSINSVAGIAIVLASVGFSRLLLTDSKVRKAFGIFLLCFFVLQATYSAAQFMRKDSRDVVLAWLESNIQPGSVVGVNSACGYAFPRSKNFEVVYDPKAEKKLDVYVFDMYWRDSLFYPEYSRSSWFLEFNPKYSHWYHSHNLAPEKFISISLRKRSLLPLIPDGYFAEVITGYGPDVIIMQKQT